MSLAITAGKIAQIINKYMQETYPEHHNNHQASNLNHFMSSVSIEDGIGEREGENEDLSGAEPGGTGGTRKRKSITARAIRRWLRRNGYNYTDVRRGVYIDGHEREDVVAYRKQFVQTLESLWPFVVEFEDDGTIKEKEYPPGCEVGGSTRPIILITHDESTFSSNDSRRQAWVKQGTQIIRPKGRGQGIMVSEFLLPWQRLSLEGITHEQRQALGLPLQATILFEYGRENGYWEGGHLVKQVTELAIPIAQAAYPGYQFLFLFDNSSNHGAFARDALLAQNMSLGPGGKQNWLRDGYFGELGQHGQSMWEFYINQEGEEDTRQKGIKRVLEERGLWPEEGDRLLLECAKKLCVSCMAVKNCKECVSGTRCLGCRKDKVCSSYCTRRRKCDECERRRTCSSCTKKIYCLRCRYYSTKGCVDCASLGARCEGSNCCARSLMASQPDFQLQNSMLVEEIEQNGHLVMFFPKFHCEINWIEYFWAQCKRYTREHCDYTLTGLRARIPDALASVKETTIHGCYHQCPRRIQAFRGGVIYGTPDYDNYVKEYKSHRRVYFRKEALQ